MRHPFMSFQFQGEGRWIWLNSQRRRRRTSLSTTQATELAKFQWKRRNFFKFRPGRWSAWDWEGSELIASTWWFKLVEFEFNGRFGLFSMEMKRGTRTTLNLISGLFQTVWSEWEPSSWLVPAKFPIIGVWRSQESISAIFTTVLYAVGRCFSRKWNAVGRAGIQRKNKSYHVPATYEHNNICFEFRRRLHSLMKLVKLGWCLNELSTNWSSRSLSSLRRENLINNSDD